MYLEIFLADFTVFRVFWEISRDFAEIPEFRGCATARNIRSPVESAFDNKKKKAGLKFNPGLVLTSIRTTGP